MDTRRECKCCKRVLEISCYNPMGYGYRRVCRDCQRKRQREYNRRKSGTYVGNIDAPARKWTPREKKKEVVQGRERKVFRFNEDVQKRIDALNKIRKAPQ